MSAGRGTIPPLAPARKRRVATRGLSGDVSQNSFNNSQASDLAEGIKSLSISSSTSLQAHWGGQNGKISVKDPDESSALHKSTPRVRRLPTPLAAATNIVAALDVATSSTIKRGVARATKEPFKTTVSSHSESPTIVAKQAMSVVKDSLQTLTALRNSSSRTNQSRIDEDRSPSPSVSSGVPLTPSSNVDLQSAEASAKHCAKALATLRVLIQRGKISSSFAAEVEGIAGNVVFSLMKLGMASTVLPHIIFSQGHTKPIVPSILKHCKN
jgi:hypothetical protein